MEEEISQLRDTLHFTRGESYAGMEFFCGEHRGLRLVLVRCGISKVNAALCAQLLIDRYGAGRVINVGYAGALDSELSLGDMVISDELVQHDFDTSAFGDEPGLIPRLGIKFFRADKTLCESAYAVCCSMPNVRVFIGRIASGDQFISSWVQKARIADLFDPMCVEMEGAAIAQCCVLNGVPFVVVRCISDKSDQGAEISFASFIKRKAEDLAAVVVAMVERLG
jgi:adenosylhomocysteine nucleosidase